jgi:hypothetical protein
MLFDSFLGLAAAIVIHHTGVFKIIPGPILKRPNWYRNLDCGVNYFKEEEICKVYKSRLPKHLEIDGMVLRAFGG